MTFVLDDDDSEDMSSMTDDELESRILNQVDVMDALWKEASRRGLIEVRDDGAVETIVADGYLVERFSHDD